MNAENQSTPQVSQNQATPTATQRENGEPTQTQEKWTTSVEGNEFRLWCGTVRVIRASLTEGALFTDLQQLHNASIDRLLAKQAPPSATTKEVKEGLEKKDTPTAFNLSIQNALSRLFGQAKRHREQESWRWEDHACRQCVGEAVIDESGFVCAFHTVEKLLSETGGLLEDASGFPESSFLSATTQAEGGEEKNLEEPGA